MPPAPVYSDDTLSRHQLLIRGMAPRVSAVLVLSAAAGCVLAGRVVDYVDPHPRYSFSYGVSDPYSGDHKSHVESRDGDVVRGQYRLVDADGTERVVTYTADDAHGFRASVQRLPLLGHPAAAAGSAAVRSTVPTAVSHQQFFRQEGPSVPVLRYTGPEARYAPPAAYTGVPAPVARAQYATGPVFAGAVTPSGLGPYASVANYADPQAFLATSSTFPSLVNSYSAPVVAADRAVPGIMGIPPYQRSVTPYVYNYGY